MTKLDRSTDALRKRIQTGLVPGLYPLIEHVSGQAARLGLPVYLVGGFVRDLLLEQSPFDLDFVVHGDAHRLAQCFAAQGRVHLDRFGTAHWTLDQATMDTFGLEPEGDSFSVDFASARTETYAYSGALPTIDPLPASIEQDLRRRDFTINALALRLSDMTIIDVTGGLDDLENGIVRVLHDQSFNDDPTRIFRAARYAVRFNFQVAPDTEALIAPALHIIARMSGERIIEELRRIFAEHDFGLVMMKLLAWEVLKKIHPQITVSDAFHFRLLADLFNASGDKRAGDAYFYWLFQSVTNFNGFIQRFGNPAWISTLRIAQQVADVLPDFTPAMKPSAIVAQVETIIGKDTRALDVGVAIAQTRNPLLQVAPIRDWLRVQPLFTGLQLMAFGLQPGPEFGKMLRKLRDMRLDGEITTVRDEHDTVLDWTIEGFDD